jgi:ribonuclease HI
VIKSKVLINFIVEWTEIQMPPSLTRHEHWTLYFDGLLIAVGKGGQGHPSLPSRRPHGVRHMTPLRTTNNIVEYEALIHGLKITSELGARCLFIRGD